MSALVGASGEPQRRQRLVARAVDRMLHPLARRRRTAAHRRVLHRQGSMGLVTGISSDRFEMDVRNRRLLGLDPGPPVPRHDDEPAAEAPDEPSAEAPQLVEARPTDDGDVVHATEPVAVGVRPEPSGADPETQPMSAVDPFDALGEAINLALTDTSGRHDVSKL